MKYLLPRIFLLLVTIESSIVANAILNAPSEMTSARWLGLSTSRLVMLGGVLLFALITLSVLVISLLWRAWFNYWQKLLQHKFRSRVLIAWSTILFVLNSWTSIELAIYASVVQEPVMQAILVRLQPLLIGSALISVELLCLFWVWHWCENGIRPLGNKTTLFVLLIWTFFLLLALFQSLSGYGLTEEALGTDVFRSPETPVLGVQVLSALLIVFGTNWLWGQLADTKVRLFVQSKWRNQNVLLGLLISGCAFFAWMSVPLQESWFADAPRPMNYTFSPNSDAYLYDAVGQSVLVGAGFWHPQWGAMVLRPMYSGILALFHQIGGLGYENIIWLQVFVLALFPACVFHLTTTLHCRLSGVLAALLVIFREYNAISLADTITVSHAKVLMADLPATLGAVLVVLLVVKWVQNPRQRVLPLIAGGAIGFFLLIRMEAVALVAVLVLAGFCLVPRNPSKWLQGMGLAAMGFVLMVAPWVWRNWQVTQRFYIVSPNYEEQIIDKIFGRGIVPENMMLGTGVGGGALSSYSPTVELHDLLRQKEDQWSGSEKLLHHYFNSQMQTLLYLPMSPRLLIATTTVIVNRQFGEWMTICCSSQTYVRSLPYWWNNWDGTLATESILSMGIILIVIAVGVYSLWHKQGFMGLIPVFTAIIYFFVLAFLGRSGGRWILEMDWVSIVVYSVGIVEIIVGVVNWLNRKKIPLTCIVHNDKVLTSFKGGVTVAALILFVGVALPAIEQLIPQRYTQAGIDIQINKLLLDESGILSEQDKMRLSELMAEDIEIWYGRALYPRYFQAGDGMDGLRDIYKHPFSRTEFFLVGTKNNWAVLPQADAVVFPHAADVLLIGKETPGYLNVIGAITYLDGEVASQGIMWSNSAENYLYDSQ